MPLLIDRCPRDGKRGKRKTDEEEFCIHCHRVDKWLSRMADLGRQRRVSGDEAQFDLWVLVWIRRAHDEYWRRPYCYGSGRAQTVCWGARKYSMECGGGSTNFGDCDGVGSWGKLVRLWEDRHDEY